MKPKSGSGVVTCEGTATMKTNVVLAAVRCWYCRGNAQQGECRIIRVVDKIAYVHRRHPKKPGEVPYTAEETS